jgi:type I restriction enzyme S subunit
MKQVWEVKKLGEVCETGAGGTPLKAHKDYYEGGTIPWLLSGEVSQGEIQKATNFITEKGLKNSSAKIFPKNTVLIAMYGATAGQVGILRFEACTNQAICGILPNDRTIPEYLFYCFLSKKEELISQAIGGAQPNISQIKIKNTRIPLPPLSEQHRIVSILDQAFAAIDKARAHAERNLENVKELFESYLQGVFENGTWEKKRLGELSERVSVGHVGETSKFYCDSSIGIPFLRSQNVRSGYLNLQGLQYITPEFHESLKKSQLKKGDLLFVRVGANRGDCCVVKEDFDKLNCANIVFARIKEGNVNFIDIYCQSTVGKAQLLGMSVGAAQGVINTKSVAELEIPFPPITEQQNIVRQLDALSAETKRLESIYQQKLLNLEELKKSILQKAFNGEL